MPNLNYFIQSSKVNKRGFASIKAFITVDYKNVTKAMGMVKPKHWSTSKQRVKAPRSDEPDNNYETINGELAKFLGETMAYFLEFDKAKIKITPEIVKDYFNGTKYQLSSKMEFWEAFEDYISLGESKQEKNTVKSWRTTRDYLKGFETSQRYILTFDNMTLDFHDKFTNYVLNTNKHHYNYLASLTRKLKAFLNWSAERGYYHGTDHRKFKVEEKPGTIVTLTVEEYRKLYNYKFKSKSLARVRDIFCFGCLTGLRISDLKKLTKENVVDGMIITHMKKVKNDQPLRIPILPQAQAIIDRYSDQHFLLPEISEQKFNSYIKKAAKEAEITSPVKILDFKKGVGAEVVKTKDVLIHAHMVRKTFITLAFAAGMDIETIKEISGIRMEKTVRRYLTISNETLLNKTKRFSDIMGGETLSDLIIT
jgi:integrase